MFMLNFFHDLFVFIKILLQVHCEVECATESYAIRRHANLSVALLDYLFYYGESEPNTIFVDLCGSLKFPKLIEEFWDFFLCDSSPSVFYLHQEITIWNVIASYYFDWALAREL